MKTGFGNTIRLVDASTGKCFMEIVGVEVNIYDNIIEIGALINDLRDGAARLDALFKKLPTNIPDEGVPP